MDEVDQKEALDDLIDELCKSGKTTLDESKLKQIKAACKCVYIYIQI
jgi:polyhydroxyalkanoate synthesis regulator phasin